VVKPTGELPKVKSIDLRAHHAAILLKIGR